MVAGWQTLLQDMLVRMDPFLKPGTIITFQKLLPDEKLFFNRLVDDVPIPKTTKAFYLPPSVRHQMLGGTDDVGDKNGLSDAGVLVACRADGMETIVNALFAHGSCTPAVDVYEQGKLVAGYQYTSIDECRSELGTILMRHLQRPPVASQVQKET
jgi:hypothetical protein